VPEVISPSLPDALPIWEAWQSLAGEAAIAVGDPAADGRRIGALRVAEAAADAEAAPVRGTHLQRTQAPLKAALAGQVCDDLGLRSEEHTSELQSREKLV